jgi:hypothetical protein
VDSCLAFCTLHSCSPTASFTSFRASAALDSLPRFCSPDILRVQFQASATVRSGIMHTQPRSRVRCRLKSNVPANLLGFSFWVSVQRFFDERRMWLEIDVETRKHPGRRALPLKASVHQHNTERDVLPECVYSRIFALRADTL